MKQVICVVVSNKMQKSVVVLADRFFHNKIYNRYVKRTSKFMAHDENNDCNIGYRGSTNLESIQIIKKSGGSLRDSFLDEGFILDKKIGIGQPKRIENAEILVANTAMDTDKVKIDGACVRVDSMAKVAEIETAEKDKMREKVNKIIGHGINCYINRQLIYNFPEELFADA